MCSESTCVQNGVPTAMPARTPRRSIRQTYVSPAVSRKAEAHRSTDFLSPLTLEDLTISEGDQPPAPSPSPCRQVAHTPEPS